MKRTLITLAFALSTGLAGFGVGQAGLLDPPTAAAQTVAQPPAAVAPALTPAAPAAAPATAQTFTCTAPAAAEPATPAPPTPAPAPAREGLLNLNAATAAQLDALPVKGLGKGYSKRIADYAQAHRFTSVDQLAEVPGLPGAVVDQLRELVTV